MEVNTKTYNNKANNKILKILTRIKRLKARDLDNFRPRTVLLRICNTETSKHFVWPEVWSKKLVAKLASAYRRPDPKTVTGFALHGASSKIKTMAADPLLVLLR